MSRRTKYPEHKCFNPCGRTLLIISFLVPIALAIALFVPPHDDYAYQSSRFFQVIYCTCLTFTMVTSMKFAPFEAAFGLTLLVKIARRSGVMFALMFFSYLIVLFFTRPFLGEIVVFFKYLFNFSESFVGALHRITLILFIVFSIILSFRHTPTSSRFRIPRIVWRPVSSVLSLLSSLHDSPNLANTHRHQRGLPEELREFVHTILRPYCSLLQSFLFLGCFLVTNCSPTSGSDPVQRLDCLLIKRYLPVDISCSPDSSQLPSCPLLSRPISEFRKHPHEAKEQAVLSPASVLLLDSEFPI
ncbi:hypothetical protein BLNAU_18637 [Blattamonas nauphoetae]|uniref:Uncharacterized protein n=1 Tax=Blattamonas nauphoetae TaxID=2049346 RepID=A0ABQ9X3N8_9EUKA|nr:hypothetical protein BLNAU_18637 [Blattamonas nauphoetae]